MSDASEMLRQLSEPWACGERVKCVIDRTARLVNLTYWRTFNLWYGKARRVEAHEIEQIQQALRQKNESAAQNELRDIRTRIAQLKARLETGDADFHRPSIDHARELDRQLRELAGSVVARRGCIAS